MGPGPMGPGPSLRIFPAQIRHGMLGCHAEFRHATPNLKGRAEFSTACREYSAWHANSARPTPNSTQQRKWHGMSAKTCPGAAPKSARDVLKIRHGMRLDLIGLCMGVYSIMALPGGVPVNGSVWGGVRQWLCMGSGSL